MGLHDRIKNENGGGPEEQPVALATNPAIGEQPRSAPR